MRKSLVELRNAMDNYGDGLRNDLALRTPDAGARWLRTTAQYVDQFAETFEKRCADGGLSVQVHPV